MNQEFSGYDDAVAWLRERGFVCGAETENTAPACEVWYRPDGTTVDVVASPNGWIVESMA